MITSKRYIFMRRACERWALPMLVFSVSLIQSPNLALGLEPDSAKTASSGDILSLDLETLLNVKVTTASRFSESLSDAPGIMHVITRDELQRYKPLTLSEILNRVPGLALTTASFTDRSMVASRGDQTAINSGHILYLINGRPTREVLEGGIASDLLESFPVNILERVEVILGPGSVLYGSNAYSAVVNLITRKADGNKFSITTQGGAGNSIAPSAQATFQRGAFSVVAAEQSHLDQDWTTPVNTGIFGTQMATIPNRGKGAYLGVNFKGLSLMSSYTDLTTSYIEGEVGQATWRRGFGDLGYSAKPTGNWDTSLNLTFTRTTLDARKYIPGIARDSYDVVFEWTNAVNLGARDQLTFGALYNRIRGAENFYFAGTTTVISQGTRPGGAFYGQLDHKLLDNLKVIGGLQANKIGSLNFNVVPRGGIIWKPGSHYTVKALYSEAFRAPSINETKMDYVPPPVIGGPSLLGNPNLVPEHVATSDLELLYANNRVEAEVNYFYSKQANDIVEGTVTSAGQYVNLGQATFHGGELELKYYLHKDFLLVGAGSYQGNHDGSGNTNITPVPNLGAKMGLSYQAGNGITASLFDVHEGPLSGYSQAINPRPTAYDLLNSHFAYDLSRFLHPEGVGISLTAQGNDLLDKAVWLPDWKDVPGDSIFLIRGRSVLAGMVVSF